MGAPTGGAIRAGRAFVEMFADPSALIRTLEATKKRVENFGKNMGKIGLTAAAAGSAVFTPIAKLFADAVKEGADVEGLAKRFHTTAESISTLRGAFAQAGIGSEEFGGALNGLATKIAAAADGNEELISGLQGLRGNMLLGRGIDEQLDAIAEKFETIVAAEDQIRVANELGLGGMLEYLKKGKAGMDELRAAAVANGDAMSGEDAKAASTIYKEFNRTMLALKSTLISIGKALLPTGRDFAQIGTDIRNALLAVREWIAGHKEVVVAVTAVAGGMVAGGLAITGLSAVATIAIPIIGALKIVVAGLGVVLSFVAGGPIGLLTGAVAALGVLWLTTTESGKTFTDTAKSGISDLATTAKSAFGGLFDAIKSGNWDLAGKIMTAGLTLAWEQAIKTMTELWENFRTTVIGSYVDGIIKAADAIKGLSSGSGSTAGGGGGSGSGSGSSGGFWSNFSFDSVTNLARDSLHGYRALWIATTESTKEAEKYVGRIKEAQLASEAYVLAAEEKEKAKAKAKVDVAKKALDDLLQEAKASKEFEDARRQAIKESDAANRERPVRKVEAEIPIPSFAALSEFAKGTFGGGSIQQTLGYGDNVGQRQLDAQIGIQQNTANSAKLLQDIASRPGPVYT